MPDLRHAAKVVGGSAQKTAKSVTKTWRWVMRVTMALLLGLVVGAATVMFGVVPKATLFQTAETTSDTKVIQAVEREEQVVLLSLGIQGLKSDRKQLESLGFSFPFRDRTVYLQYSYRAKLGINGKDVKVEQAGDNKYKVTIPKFIFIGHSDEHFEPAIENNSALSWLTSKKDPSEMINEILNEDEINARLDENNQALKDQANSFYSGIIHGVEPSAEIEFAYR